PIPLHPVGIWLGAYKPRMLRLTGRAADGWIPTLAYAAPGELGPMTRIIDEAARNAGRDPGSVRRVYNVAGRFTPATRGFLDGPPELWVAQLADLVLEYGFSAFLLSPGEGDAADLERFATIVAPGVREAVAHQPHDGAPELLDARKLLRAVLPCRDHPPHDRGSPHVPRPPPGG
ncbi:MAG: LLM class flavin-dependent oxidoreductase, partial [Chloroflexi bacterium]|nr:LLM class flavin-dependent oxidoreductase [Chloroflexota bacterium]